MLKMRSIKKLLACVENELIFNDIDNIKMLLCTVPILKVHNTQIKAHTRDFIRQLFEIFAKIEIYILQRHLYSLENTIIKAIKALVSNNFIFIMKH